MVSSLDQTFNLFRGKHDRMPALRLTGQTRETHRELGPYSEVGIVRACITDGGGSEQVWLGHQKRFSKYIIFELGLEG